MAELIKMLYAMWTCGLEEACIRWGCTLALPGEYSWTIHVWWQCGLMSNYFDHFFSYASFISCNL